MENFTSSNNKVSKPEFINNDYDEYLKYKQRKKEEEEKKNETNKSND